MKRLLIVVDYQNDFVDGALGFEGAELLEGPIARKIEEYREAGDTICFTYDTHHKDYLDTQEGRKLPIPHCIEGSEGHDLYGSIASKQEDYDEVFLKPTFGSTALFERLINRQAVAMSVGTACTAAPDPAMNEKALDIMEGLQIEVINRPSADDE